MTKSRPDAVRRPTYKAPRKPLATRAVKPSSPKPASPKLPSQQARNPEHYPYTNPEKAAERRREFAPPSDEEFFDTAVAYCEKRLRLFQQAFVLASCYCIDEEDSHGNDDEAHPQARFRIMLRVFKDVDRVIITLIGLHAGLPVHASLFGDLSSTLISVARFSAEHYCNTAYDTLVSETLTELGSYEGQETQNLPHSKKFLKSLSAYG
jgi:hypothetical protein